MGTGINENGRGGGKDGAGKHGAGGMNAVIFDMDGLMFDTEAIQVKAWDSAGEQMGLGKIGYVAVRLAGSSSKAAKDKILAEEFGETYRWDDFSPYLAEYRRQYFRTHEVPVKKGLYRLLDYLEKEHWKMAVASSTPRAGVEDNLRKTGVLRYFAGAVVAGDMVTASKPDPEIFLKACELLGEEPEHCYALEDSRNGLYAARAAGCRVCMVPDLWQPDNEVREFAEGIFPDLDAFREYLESARFRGEDGRETSSEA